MWTEPVEGQQDIDSRSTNAIGETLNIQVVRASNNGRLWQEVNRAGSAMVEYDASAVAREMIGVIRVTLQPPERTFSGSGGSIRVVA
jgi:hypothetical protein